MRDDSHFWDAPSDATQIYRGLDLTITELSPDRQVVVSGTLVLSQTDLPLVEWPGPAPDGPYAIVLRRDRVIEINGPAREDGWHAETGQAINDVTDGYTMVQFEGTRALDLLKCGGFVNPEDPSRSVSRLMFGLPALLYQGSAPDSYILHVTRTYGEALRKILLSHLET